MSGISNSRDPRDILRSMNTWEEFNLLASGPTLVSYCEVFDERISTDSLVEYMDRFAASGILRGVAYLGWANDKAADEGRDWHRKVGEAIDEEFGTRTVGMIDQGRLILSRMSISKLVELLTNHAGRQGEAADPTPGQLGRMLLAANELCDGVAASYSEIDIAKAYLESSSPSELQHRIDDLDDEQFRDWIVDFAANQQAAFLHYRRDMVETLAPAFLDTWRVPCAIDNKRWPESSCLADVFSAETGFDVFEYAAIGMELYRRAVEGKGQVLVDETASRLFETRAGEAVKERVVVEFSAGISELRDLYSQQQYPVIFLNGVYFVPDSQKLLRRFLEAPVELDLLSTLSEDGSRRAEVKRLLERRFEARISNRLRRVARRCQGATLFSELDLQPHFSVKAGLKQKLSCCDWVLSSPFASIYFEATKRSVPFSVIGPSGSGLEFGHDLEKNYIKRKFRQIASTFANEITYGFPGAKPGTARPVRFGFVILPRGGFASEAALEVVLRSSVGEYLPADIDQREYNWLSIAFLNESDLTLLEGWAEYHRIDVSRLLFDWRLMSAQVPAPVSLEEFAELNGLDRPLPTRDVKRAEIFRKLCMGRG